MSDERTEVFFGANIADVKAKLLEMQAGTKEAVEGINTSLNTIKSTVSGVGEALAAVFAIEMFGHMIDETAELASHLEILSQKTGMSVDDLSRLRYAADLSHIGVDSLDTGMTRLARSMEDAAKGGASPAAEAFRAMGISVTDAEGNLRPMRDVFLEVASKFATYSDGAEKSALAMNIFGRSGADLVPLLNKGAEGIQELGAQQDALNATMTEQNVQVSIDYENAMKRLSTSMRGVRQDIATALMPALTSLAEAFTDSGSTGDLLASAMDLIGGAIRGVGIVAVAVKFLVEETYETFHLVFSQIGILLGGMGAAFMAFVHGDFSGSAAIAKATFSDMGADVTATSDRMKDHADAAAASMLKLAYIKPPMDPDAGESKRTGTAPKLAPAMANDGLVVAKAEWAQRANAATEGKDTLLEIEMDFWQSKMDATDRGTKDGQKLYDQYQAQLLASIRTYNADAKKEGQIQVQAVRDNALAQLDIDKQTIEEERALREIDARDAQTLLVANANAAYQLKKQALDDEMALADGDLVRMAQLQQQRTALERSHTKELAGIHKETTLEITHNWESTFSTIARTVETSFDGVIKRTETLRDAMRNVFRGIALDYIEGKLEEAKTDAAVEIAKREAAGETAAHAVAMTAWSGLQTIASKTWEGIQWIAIEAAKAAASAWAAISAIPLVGPFLAPVAAAAALAGVLALGANISAAGGYDIPAGLNPVTQLHAQEMVLPADLANKVRGMTGGGGGDTHVHFHAIDIQSFRDFAKRNPEGFGDGVAAAIASNHSGLVKALRNRG